MIEQKNIGSGNANNSNSNNKITCIININGKDETVEILSILNAVAQNFEVEDKKINESLPNKILVNKTNHKEAYQTVKIITSLLQLGIPLVATYEIAQSTVNRIKEFCYNNSTSTESLTTKDIRKMVSQSIQEMDIEKFSYSDIESWNNLYIRRYGHNNKRVKIYYPNSDESDFISYEYIHNKLLKDIVSEITKTHVNYAEIPSRHKRDVATEILAFINRCDLYKINYVVLKDIIKEIALQPPHPWFINQETKEEIIEYDVKCLKKNISELEESISNNINSPQSAKIEVLHHASALILEKYNFFLGCYDLSSFYLLKDLLNNLIDREKWDFTVTYSKTSELLLDLSFSFIEVVQLNETINQINNFLKNQDINNLEFDKLLIQFSDYALQLFELGHKNEVYQFIETDWKTLPASDITKYLKLLMYSIYPVKIWKLETNEMFFWINYKTVRSESFENIKNQIFVVYNDGNLSDYNFLVHLETASTINACNVIFAIAENEEIAIKTRDSINEYLTNHQLAREYMVFWMNKSTAKKLFEAKNKMRFLDKLMLDQSSFD